MTRGSFLKKLGLAIVAVAVAPAVNLLSEKESICHKGLLWYAENYGKQCTYNGNFTYAEFCELIEKLEMA